MYKGLIAILMFFCIAACKSTQLVNPEKTRYKGMYKEFLEADEKELLSGYQYIATRNGDGKYVFRNFYPETKTLVSEEEYKTKAFKVLSGKSTKWTEGGQLKSISHFLDGRKHGKWISYVNDSLMLNEGDYHHGKKVGNWKAYYKDGTLRSERNYNNGLREGKYTLYDRANNIICEFDYKSDTIYNIIKGSILLNNNEQKLFNKKEELFDVDQYPQWHSCMAKENGKQLSQCTNTEILKFVYSNHIYPLQAKEKGIVGTTIVSFIVNEDGSVSDIACVRGISDDLKQASLGLIAKMPNWIPATKDGHPAKMKITIPIKFNIIMKQGVSRTRTRNIKRPNHRRGARFPNR